MDFEYILTSRTKYIQVILNDGESGSEFNILEKGKEVFHLYIDMNELFSGINLSYPNNLKVVTAEENQSARAERMAINITRMFNYEGE